MTDHLPSSVGYAHFVFDDYDSARLSRLGGWCLFENETRPFSSIGQLDQEQIWFSNLTQIQHRALIPDNQKHIKPSNFFPISLSQLRAEIAPKGISDEDFGRTLIELCENLLRLCICSYGEKFLNNLLAQPSFARAIATTIHIDGHPEHNDELHSEIIWRALSSSHVLSSLPRRDGPEVPVCHFRAPMPRHLELAQETPLPSPFKPWREVRIEQSAIPAFLSENQDPAIVEVTNLQLPRHLHGLYSPKRYPIWMTSIEAAFLSMAGLIEIGRVFLQPDGYEKDITAWHAMTPNVTGPLSLSYCGNMLLYGHMLSACVPLNERNWPLRSWWIRSMDRMLMSTSIMPIHAIDGITVYNYGEGAVTLGGSPEAMAQALTLAPKTGLLPTQSAWHASTTESNRKILSSDNWLPNTMNTFESLSYQLSSREFAFTLQIDSACMLAITSEQQAIHAISEILKSRNKHDF